LLCLGAKPARELLGHEIQWSHMNLGLRTYTSLILVLLSYYQTMSMRVEVLSSTSEEAWHRRVHSAVEYAFDSYRKQLTRTMTTMDRMGRGMHHHPKLSEMFTSIHSVIAEIPQKWQANEDILRELTSITRGLSFNSQNLPLALTLFESQSHIEDPPRSPKTAKLPKARPSSYDSFEQVLLHLSRDWGKEASEVRSAIYDQGLILAAQQFIPSGARVLVPGAGLGRLVVHLKHLGYDVEANESSLVMGVVFCRLLERFFPQDLKTPQAVAPSLFYPYLSTPTMDEWRFSDRLVGVDLPRTIDFNGTASTTQAFGQTGGNSLTPIRLRLGSFGESYSGPEYASSFDAVVTSFFIDTSDDIIHTIAILSHILTHGGIWINLGPLHYHSNATKVPLSHDLLQQVATASGFDLLSEKRIATTSYAGEDSRSMKPEVYVVPLSVYKLMRPEDRLELDRVEVDEKYLQETEPGYPKVDFIIK